MDYQLIIDEYIGDWWLGTDKQSIRHKLEKFKGKHVDVKISSLGGSIGDGLDIRQQFIDHGDVTAHLHGFVASAATIIAMGAKRIVMGKYALFLVHQCSNTVVEIGQMNATGLQALIDKLKKNKEENEKIDAVLAGMYASRCKNHSQEELLDLLKESKWLTAQEALDWGFVDEILDTDDAHASRDPELAKTFNAAGLPIDGLEIKPERGGLLQSIFDSLKSIKEMITPKDKLATCKKDCSAITINMENEFKSVASVLKVDTLASQDGAVNLSVEQLQAIESRLNKLEAQHKGDADAIAQRDKTIGELKQQVENLKKSPADETGKVDETTPKPQPQNSKEMFNSIKDLI